ncbi:AraC family transcriptional regulator [Clostridium hydrogenum]|uniref:AraC family transcriptional regulator n=1 Tax=Clostridium hydrogenum TaxID=2855764 RepID=UPI001F488D5B|nr:helix-turn-helix domain-containing protein [Clostridium hydrogenum]
MLNITGYYQEEVFEGIEDNSDDIIVNSAGHQKLITKNKFETVRPCGRRDFQILYVASGLGHYKLGNSFETAEEGTFIIYFPNHEQNYHYFLCENPEIYWIHFTGYNALSLLENSGYSHTGFYKIARNNKYNELFNRIIQEIQLKRSNYLLLSKLYLQEIVANMSRDSSEHNTPHYSKNDIIFNAIQFFQCNYKQDINIEKFALENNLSYNYFIKIFKNFTQMTPNQYVIQARLSKAKNLLLDSNYNVCEIAAMIGYDNPLYFSHIFKKYTGNTPTDFRNKIRNIAT